MFEAKTIVCIAIPVGIFIYYIGNLFSDYSVRKQVANCWLTSGIFIIPSMIVGLYYGFNILSMSTMILIIAFIAMSTFAWHLCFWWQGFDGIIGLVSALPIISIITISLYYGTDFIFYDFFDKDAREIAFCHIGVFVVVGTLVYLCDDGYEKDNILVFYAGIIIYLTMFSSAHFIYYYLDLDATIWNLILFIPGSLALGFGITFCWFRLSEALSNLRINSSSNDEPSKFSTFMQTPLREFFK
jgi:hypothetical protein